MQINVATLITFLSPVLPFLLGVGEKTADGFIHKMGADAWDRAKKILFLLRPQIDQDPEAKEVVELFIDEPNSKASRILLRKKFTEILKNNKQLAQEIFFLMGSDPDIPKIVSNIKADTIKSSGSRNTIQVGTDNISIGQGRDIKIQTSAKDNLNSL